MEFIRTYIEDLFLMKTNILTDDRGLFYRSYCAKELLQINIKEAFVQTNISCSLKKGSVRGMHMQCSPFSEIKIIRCIQGRVYDVAIDLRKGSPTFLKYYGVELSSDNALSMIIPKGFAHGFQTLEDNSTMLYQHSNYYEVSSEFAISSNEPKVAIRWPLEFASISDKDRNIQFLEDWFEGIEI